MIAKRFYFIFRVFVRVSWHSASAVSPPSSPQTYGGQTYDVAQVDDISPHDQTAPTLLA